MIDPTRDEWDAAHKRLCVTPATNFPHWQENVRAIALGLESLRKVDRYGIGRRGEQYVGWKALSAGSGSSERGRELIEEHGSERAALMATHPDRGGDPGDFAAVQAARELSGEGKP